MTTTSPHEPPASHSQGSISKMKRLHDDGKHSVAELREFIAQMRGRSPQEVLGMVSSSALIRATVQATLGTLILFAIFTIGPYFWAQKQSVAVKPAAAVESVAAQPAAPVANVTPSSPTDNNPLPGEPDAAKAAKALDIGETKTADPNVNPLDKDLDKLLDGK